MEKLSIPSKKLRIDFGWMLNRVADYLSKVDCNKIAHAEQIPKSLIDPDSDLLPVTLLHTLEGRGKFSPLNPEGLIEILKKIPRLDAIKEVNQYKSEQIYKSERELYKQRKKESKRRGKQQKCTEKIEAENKEEVERMVAEAKSRTFALIAAKMKELEECEMNAKRYSEGEVSIEEVRASFMRYSETLDANARRYRTASMSSNSTNTSDGCSTSEGSSISEDDHYAPLPALSQVVPVQETERDAALQERLTKPIPLPRTKCSQAPPTQGIATPTQGVTPTLQRVPQPLAPGTSADVDDFTGGTGDSGLGTGESDRMAWTKDSQFPVTAQTIPHSKPQAGHTPPPVPPRRSTPGYMTLQRREPSMGEGYTKPIRPGTMDDLMAELKQRRS